MVNKKLFINNKRSIIKGENVFFLFNFPKNVLLLSLYLGLQLINIECWPTISDYI